MRLRGAVVVGRDGAAASKDEEQNEQAREGLGDARSTATGGQPVGSEIGARIHGPAV